MLKVAVCAVDSGFLCQFCAVPPSVVLCSGAAQFQPFPCCSDTAVPSFSNCYQLVSILN